VGILGYRLLFIVILVLSYSVMPVCYMELRLDVLFVNVHSVSSVVSLQYMIVRLGIVLFMA
jgi:hypothetical protein